MKKSGKSSSIKINGIKIEDMNTRYLIKQINLLSVVSIFSIFGACAPILMCLTAWELIGLWPIAILLLVGLAMIINVRNITAMKNELKSRNVSAEMNRFLNKNLKYTIMIYILGIIAIGTAMIGIVTICLPDIFDNAVVSAMLIVTAIVCGIFCRYMYNKNKKEENNFRTDEELIAEFKECATYIQTMAQGASGLKGVGSRMATNSVNDKIAKKREIGESVAEELISRGYKVDTSVLMQNAVRAKSKSNLAKIIGAAVVGGVIAGDVGAIIGAAYEINKNTNKNNK